LTGVRARQRNATPYRIPAEGDGAFKTAIIGVGLEGVFLLVSPVPFPVAPAARQAKTARHRWVVHGTVPDQEDRPCGSARTDPDKVILPCRPWKRSRSGASSSAASSPRLPSSTRPLLSGWSSTCRRPRFPAPPPRRRPLT